MNCRTRSRGLPVCKSVRSCVYVITHTATARHYVGKSTKPAQRWAQHKRGHAARRSYIQDAIRKYGAGAFEFLELEWFESEAEAYEAESWWVAFLRSNIDGFNLSTGGEGSPGHVSSDAHREAVSAGAKRRWSKPGEKEKLRELMQSVHLGSKRGPETRAKIAAKAKGRKISDETKRKISFASVGIKRPGVSKALLGKRQSTEHIEKRMGAHRGAKRSEATKQKMRDAWARRRAAACR